MTCENCSTLTANDNKLYNIHTNSAWSEIRASFIHIVHVHMDQSERSPPHLHTHLPAAVTAVMNKRALANEV